MFDKNKAYVGGRFIFYLLEEHILISSISGDKVDGKTAERWKDIATAIFLDKEKDLKDIFLKGKSSLVYEIEYKTHFLLLYRL